MARPRKIQNFADTIDLSLSAAEKILRGERLPSVPMLARIVLANDLDGTEALRAVTGGPLVFAAWLREALWPVEVAA